MSPLHRIIDANANRAREALRAMEDAARFGLESHDLIELMKGLRHDLRRALDQPALDRALLLSSRDSLLDAGREIKTSAELSRESLRDIAAAAASRLTEALRSIEECAKALGGNADSRPIERLRYQAYEAEKRLLLALPTGRARQWRLCVLLTESLCTQVPWFEVARAAVDAGADCIQLREKTLPDRELLDRATELLSLLGSRADLLINDRPDIALLCGARGVHVGQTDLPAAQVRKVIGFNLLIGVSTSTLAEARASAGGEGGADYCGVGPMFPTTTKHKDHISGPAYLREYLADSLTSQRPHLAIGGVTPDNIQQLADAGCRGVAVSSAVCGAKEPGEVCRTMLQFLARSKSMAESAKS